MSDLVRLRLGSVVHNSLGHEGNRNIGHDAGEMHLTSLAVHPNIRSLPVSLWQSFQTVSMS